MNSVNYLETIKALDGKIYHLEYHQNRFNNTLKGSNIILKDILNPPSSGLYRCRVVYNNDHVTLMYNPYKKRDIRRLKLIFDDTITYSKKYLDRSAIDKLFAQKSFCDDILIVKNGLITDTSIANVAFKYKNEWLTPKKPLLYGTTRARLLEKSKIFEENIDVKELKNFSHVALMNAVIDFDIIPNENIREIIC